MESAMRLQRWPSVAAAWARGLPTQVRLFARAMALVLRPEPAVSAAYLALVLVSSLLAVAQVWLGKLVVDRLALLTGTAAPGEGATRAAIWSAALYAVVM